MVAERDAVDQEEDPLRAAEAQQAVGLGGGHVGLAPAHGYRHQRLGAVVTQGQLEVADRLLLDGPHALGVQGRELAQSRTQGMLLLRPRRERLGAMEVEDFARSADGIAPAREQGLDSGRDVVKGQPIGVPRIGLALDALLEAVRVALGLALDAAQRATHRLGLDRPDRLGRCEQQVVDRPPSRRELPYGDALGGGDVGVLVVLDNPPGGLEELVDEDAGFLLGEEAGCRQGGVRGSLGRAAR